MNALNTITNFMYMPFDDSGQGYECPLSHRGTTQPFLRQPLIERLRSPPFVRWCRERQLLGAQTESRHIARLVRFQQRNHDRAAQATDAFKLPKAATGARDRLADPFEDAAPVIQT